jgi:CheY-like chemotaxis protein
MDMTTESGDNRLNGLKLLVVEDDDDTRELLRVLFQTNGAAVTAVSSVPEALEAYDESRPDVLIADIGMPDYNGYTLIGRVRARDRENQGKIVPAIALTAYATAIDRDTVLSAGFQVHIPKPFEPRVLVSTVADLANRYSNASP